MKPIFIFRHIACEGPGYLAEVLTRRDIPFRVVTVDQGEEVPDTIQGASALVFMGGPMSVNDDLPWIPNELRLIRQASESGMPLLGHCLGSQLIARALGATVGPNPVKEIGWLPVVAESNEAASLWIDDLPSSFEVFHWHGETFSLPEGVTPILHSAQCTHQGFVTERGLALQCHIEMTAELVREWSDLYRDEIASPGPTVQGYETIRENLDARVTALHRIADVLYEQWLSRFP
jgi:GMP synthase-like glutamine amidotransferase